MGGCINVALTLALLCDALQGILRTREVVERLKAVAPTPGQKPAILVYLGVLLQKGKLNALESAELARYGGTHLVSGAAVGCTQWWRSCMSCDKTESCCMQLCWLPTSLRPSS